MPLVAFKDRVMSVPNHLPSNGMPCRERLCNVRAPAHRFTYNKIRYGTAELLPVCKRSQNPFRLVGLDHYHGVQARDPQPFDWQAGLGCF